MSEVPLYSSVPSLVGSGTGNSDEKVSGVSNGSGGSHGSNGNASNEGASLLLC